MSHVLELPKQPELSMPSGMDVESEARKELAVAFYQRGFLSSGKAASFAEMTLDEFEDLLAERKAVRAWTREEMEDDLAFALGG